MRLEAHVRASLAETLLRAGMERPDHIPVERPPRSEHGDLTSRIAFLLTRGVQRSPQELAHQLAEQLQGEAPFSEVSAVAGFLNFRMAPIALGEVVRGVLVDGAGYGRSDEAAGRPLQVEFVSSNPTGPLTVGHGRQAALGDVLAELLTEQGWKVTREYYMNDEGHQIDLLARSLWARYRQALGDDVPVPEDGYQGDYLAALGEALAQQWGDRYPSWTPEAEGKVRAFAVEGMISMIRMDLQAMGVAFDVWTREGDLHRRGLVADTLEALRDRNAVYAHDGAQWLHATAHGLSRDPVLIKSDGTPTYIMVDIAYHMDKFRRGFDQVVNVQGADHVDTQRQVKLGLKLLGLPDGFLDYCIHQFVTLKATEGVQRMSTRAGHFLRLSDLVEELGRDVFRYFMVMRKPSSHLNFDYALAKDTSMENPVYYIQYAHTRVASVLRESQRTGELPSSLADVDLSPLTDEAERALILELDRFPEVLASAAHGYAPHLVCEYLEGLAGLFHPYYSRVRVLGQGAATPARLALLASVGLVLRRGLTVLGLSAPEEM